VVMGSIIGRYRQQNTQPKLLQQDKTPLADTKGERATPCSSGKSAAVAHPAQS